MVAVAVTQILRVLSRHRIVAILSRRFRHMKSRGYGERLVSKCCCEKSCPFIDTGVVSILQIRPFPMEIFLSLLVTPQDVDVNDGNDRTLFSERFDFHGIAAITCSGVTAQNRHSTRSSRDRYPSPHSVFKESSRHLS